MSDLLTRECRQCKRILHYKNENSLNRAKKKDGLCHPCATSRDVHVRPKRVYSSAIDVPADLSRQCPTCKHDLVYKSVKSYKVAFKANASCQSCSAKGIRPSLADGEGFTRSCPLCSKTMRYKLEATRDRAHKNGSICKPCSNSLHGVINIEGKRFGKLLVVAAFQKEKRTYWRCLCDCGNTKDIKGSSNLRNGNITSCGCSLYAVKVLPSRAVFTFYVHNAKRMNRAFALTEEQLAALIVQDCVYCGAAPERQLPRRLKRPNAVHQEFRWNGIDRVDSAEGYSVENTVPCCFMCNRMKMDASYEEFVAHVKRIAAHCAEKTKPHLV